MRDNYNWADRHALMTRARNADQAEREAMQYGAAPVAAGIEDDRVAGVLEDEALGPDADNWNARDEAVELAAGDTLTELERRRDMLGTAYPFELNGGRLTYRGSFTGVYEFCLAVSLAPNVVTAQYAPLAVAFELIATQGARYYLGARSEALRTGWPSHNAAERPRRFKALATIINQRSGEWIWQPKAPNPDDPTHQQVKDEGVDFVVWMPMGDGRPGKIFILGQCACGDNWDTKLDDINDDDLSQWFDVVTAARYMKAFCVPHHIPGYHVFMKCNRQAGITFDRARLTLLAEGVEHRAAFVAAVDQFNLDALGQRVIAPATPRRLVA